jgi:hypothetical protein
VERMRPIRASSRRAGTAASVLAVLVLSACSSSGSGSSAGAAAGPGAASASSPSVAQSPPASASPSASAGLEAASADEILAEARAALLRARSVHAKGNVVSEGSDYAIDLRMVRGSGATGKMAVEGKGLTLVRIGTTAYVKLDPAFLRAATNSQSSVRLLSGTYFKVTARKSAAFAPFVALTDAEQAFGSTLAPTGSVTKGKVTHIGKQRVVDLLVDGGKSGHVFVALTGTPYPVRIVYGSSAKQHVDLDGYGAKVKLTAPPASKVRTVPGF